MKNCILLLVLIICYAQMAAQNVGIGTSSPDATAALEIKASNKGILIPRTSTISRNAIVNPAKGLMLYDTTSSSFWFHNGSIWVQVGTSGNGWALTGNTGTNSSNNFLGTTDAKPLSFRVNNVNAGFIDNSTTGIVALGYQSLLANTTGFGNTGHGYNSLTANTTGSRNTAIGFYSLYTNNADNNTAVGTYSLAVNTTGTGNTATGVNSLVSNIQGNYNSAFGTNSLYTNTSGTENTANGYGALFSNTSGKSNSALGSYSMYLNNSGYGNVAIGSSALYNNSTGNTNIAIGDHALFSNTIKSNSIAIGDSALFSVNGTGSGPSSFDGYQNIAIGFNALILCTTGSFNTAIGERVLSSNTIGGDNTAVGAFALNNNTSGGNNTAIGQNTLQSNSTGSGNTAIGHGSDVSNNNLINATALGYRATVNASDKVRIGDANVTIVESQAGSWTTSDGRFKNNIKEDVKGLDFIKLLRPVTYNFDTEKFSAFLMQNFPDSVKQKRSASMDKEATAKASGIVQSGFIAQEVEEAVKKSGYYFNGVHTPESPTDNWSLSYEKLVVPLVKAVQEQQQQIESSKKESLEQQQQIEALKKENLEIKAQLKKLLETISKH